MKLVSAIMPTRGRNVWAAIALNSFMRQTYPCKQLLILDDREDQSFRDPPDLLPSVGYMRVGGRSSIAEKLNSLCVWASGGIVCRFDDDDWSAPERMADQVKRLEESGKQVTGYHSMMFHEEQLGQVWRFQGQPGFPLGTSLCFTKTFWQAYPFRANPASPPNVGEDNAFAWDARQGGQLTTVDAGQLMVARAHSQNTSPKTFIGLEWRRSSVSELPEAFPR